jgi:molybdopterin-guanine dinucleotide biosynthesis protein A
MPASHHDGAGRDAAPLRAVVLAGGRSSRMNGRHKPAIPIGGIPMVARVLAALQEAGAAPVVVGSAEGVPPGVPVLREDPPLSGPLAAVAAGVRALEPRAGGIVLVLGGDMPFVTAATLARLAEAARGGAAVAEDEDGRAQPLCAAWDEALLRARVAAVEDPAGRPLRLLYDGIRPVRVRAGAGEIRDIDTPADLRAAVDRLG